jgi:hypothetical protein
MKSNWVPPALALFLAVSEIMTASFVDASPYELLKQWEASRAITTDELNKATKEEDKQRLRIKLAGEEASINSLKKEIADEHRRKIDELNVPSDEPLGKQCYQERPMVGDLSYIGFDNWSVGTTVSAQLIRYTLGTKQAAINTGLGAGVAFRYYGNSPIGDEATVKKDQWPETVQESRPDPKTKQLKLPIYRIAPGCRATTADVGQGKKLASPIFSISPVLYASKIETVGDLNIQPAIQMGVLNDLINIGAGFNLTGQDKGKVFLLFSLGYGFKF